MFFSLSNGIAGITISAKQATVVMTAISILVMVWVLTGIFWLTAGSGGFLIGTHAFLRDASMHQDQEDAVEMSGDLTLEEDAAFLNPVGDGNVA